MQQLIESYSNWVRKMPLCLLFYRWGNHVTGKWSDLTMAPTLVSGEAKFQPWARWLQGLWTWLFTSYTGLAADLRHIPSSVVDTGGGNPSCCQQQRTGKAFGGRQHGSWPWKVRRKCQGVSGRGGHKKQWGQRVWEMCVSKLAWTSGQEEWSETK